MDDVINLINHLLNSKYSIDKIDLISEQLNISKDQIYRILRADRYKDYFQLLKHKSQGLEKLALTLDLFCCTHYAQQCKNLSCPFLHLCPYNIRPMHGKCTNKTCPYDHEVLKSAHNKKILNTRGLNFLSDNLLLEIARASADPNRSFWVCTDNGKKTGCAKKSQCDKLHYCYFSLINACTKPYCSHTINEACIAYFRRKELGDYDHDDILEVFKKVLKQRKPDFISTINLPPHPSWAVPTTQNAPIINPSKKESVSEEEQVCRPTRSVLSATAPEYNGTFVSKSNLPSPDTEDKKDILLFDPVDEDDYIQTERYLTEQIGYSIKLLISKIIYSEYKDSQNFDNKIEPIYYYCPTENFNDIFKLFRYQNEEKLLTKPLIVYSSIRDAHDATELNIEHNQFCLLRISIYQSNLIQQDSIQIDDPSIIHFDRIWIYTYNDQHFL